MTQTQQEAFFFKYGYVTIEDEADAQDFVRWLVWGEIPFRVQYKADGSAIITDMRNIEDDFK